MFEVNDCRTKKKMLGRSVNVFVARKGHVKGNFENTNFITLNIELSYFDIVIEVGKKTVEFGGKFVVDKSTGAVG